MSLTRLLRYSLFQSITNCYSLQFFRRPPNNNTIPDAGAATANALSPIFRLARRTIRLLLLDDLSDDREGSLAAGVNSSVM